ncbi:MAG: C25 family cysteine peptidase [Candidatus Thermoplasmatota archaeon]
MDKKNESRKKSILLVTAVTALFLLSGLNANALTSQSIEKDESSEEAVYDLLVLTPKRFTKQLEPLVEHKNDIGVETKMVSLPVVYEEMFWQGRDKAEKIKYFIKKSHETWGVEYVLLVGGRKNQLPSESWWMPVRYTHLSRHYDNLPEGKFLTDLYFADLYDSENNFCSWDDDNDGVFGEWPINNSAVDTPDLYPDVYVGRLPCRNILDVKIAVDKIINYETNSFHNSNSDRILLIAGDTYINKTPDSIDGEAHTQEALKYMTGFEPVKIFASKGNLKWYNMVKEINRGCDFVFFSGHGSPNSWGTHPPNNSEKWIGHLKLHHMPFLLNRQKLPIVVSASGCFNNMFNVSLTHSEWVYLFGIPSGVPRCWGETLALKPFGGSIAVIASTGFSYESSDIDGDVGGCEWLDIHFFEEYNSSDNQILGECWGDTIKRFLQNFSIDWSDQSKTGDALMAKNVEQWLLIGDPSLKIGGYKK